MQGNKRISGVLRALFLVGIGCVVGFLVLFSLSAVPVLRTLCMPAWKATEYFLSLGTRPSEQEFYRFFAVGVVLQWAVTTSLVVVVLPAVWRWGLRVWLLRQLERKG